MIDKHIFHFYLSYRINKDLYLKWVEGINLRHAKEKIMFKFPEATDLMDWTNEPKEELDRYLQKIKDQHHDEVRITIQEVDNPDNNE